VAPIERSHTEVDAESDEPAHSAHAAVIGIDLFNPAMAILAKTKDDKVCVC
jgi:hypothetical protein